MNTDNNHLEPRRHSMLRRSVTTYVAVAALIMISTERSDAQTQPGLLTSRAELTAAVQSAELGSGGRGATSALAAAAIRQRLAEGDFQPGDRIVLKTFTDASHTDTLVVRGGRLLDLPGKTTMSLVGVLRSEVKDKVAGEVLKYVKAEQIEVIPLTRVAVLGEVAHPGYFALPSDVPLTDVIMAAGGPTATADVERSLVRRGSFEFRSANETRQAISRGLTLDQFGLSAGDEIVIGRRREFLSGSVAPLLGVIGSVTLIFVTLHH
ncbi:MAG TPA: SLBB domain-containing protein [Gemmatimonadaceae bacterium]